MGDPVHRTVAGHAAGAGTDDLGDLVGLPVEVRLRRVLADVGQVVGRDDDVVRLTRGDVQRERIRLRHRFDRPRVLAHGTEVPAVDVPRNHLVAHVDHAQQDARVQFPGDQRLVGRDVVRPGQVAARRSGELGVAAVEESRSREPSVPVGHQATIGGRDATGGVVGPVDRVRKGATVDHPGVRVVVDEVVVIDDRSTVHFPFRARRGLDELVSLGLDVGQQQDVLVVVDVVREAAIDRCVGLLARTDDQGAVHAHLHVLGGLDVAVPHEGARALGAEVVDAGAGERNLPGSFREAVVLAGDVHAVQVDRVRILRRERVVVADVAQGDEDVVSLGHIDDRCREGGAAGLCRRTIHVIAEAADVVRQLAVRLIERVVRRQVSPAVGRRDVEVSHRRVGGRHGQDGNGESEQQNLLTHGSPRTGGHPRRSNSSWRRDASL